MILNAVIIKFNYSKSVAKVRLNTQIKQYLTGFNNIEEVQFNFLFWTVNPEFFHKMTTNQFLAARLREVYINGTWVANTNYKAQLQTISWEIATQKVADLNTIAVLTFHINYYLSGILDALSTGKLTIKDQFSFDAPPIKNQNEWHDLVEILLKNAESLITAVQQMDDKTLNSYFFEEKYGTYLRNIEGVIEHSYYHLGQISMLNKLFATR